MGFLKYVFVLVGFLGKLKASWSAHKLGFSSSAAVLDLCTPEM